MANISIEPIREHIGTTVNVDRACLFNDDVAHAGLAAVDALAGHEKVA